MNGICGIINKNGDLKIEEGLLGRMVQGISSLSSGKSDIRLTHTAGFGYMSQFGNDMMFSDDNIIVLCEGEFYNRNELRESLQSRGYNPMGVEEPGLCASLYKAYGLDFVSKIRGVFSIAIWDNKENILFLGTDPFSIRSITYYHDKSNLIFGSKIKSILDSHQVKKEIAPSSIIDYLYFSAIPTPSTAYKDILKLPPGHFLVLKNGKLSLKQYWDANYTEYSGFKRERYWEEEVLCHIKAAVQSNLEYCNGDDVGAFLSGGTDSSTVAGMVKDLAGTVKTFSIGFSEGRFDETSYARIAANHFNADHHEYVVTPDDAYGIISSIIKLYDDPFGNASVIPTYFCARLAKNEGINVLLAGDGGDEVFAGNERYHTDKIFSLYSEIPKGLRDLVLEPLVFNMPSGFPLVNKAIKYIKRSNIPNPKRIYSYNFLDNFGIENVFDGDFLEGAGGHGNYWGIISNYYEHAGTKNELNRLMYLDLKLAITDNDLLKVNGAAELAGIRVRYPLLDQNLVEFFGTVPARLKLKRFKKRYIFLKSLRNVLPREVIKKKKHGFGLPISVWLKEDKRFKTLARDTLLSSKSVQRGYFKKGFLESLFKMHEEDSTSYYGDNLWVFLMLELWHREHFD